MPATMKKLILFLFMLIIAPVQSAQIANVEYIHTAIADKWDITIPYNREITNVGVAANMKYLLTAVDVANEILNGKKTTDYGNGEFATMVAADTVATDTAVDGLVFKSAPTYDFCVTTSGSSGFSYATVYAAGTFYIKCDGQESIVQKDAVEKWNIPCRGKQLCMGGRATAYSSGYTIDLSYKAVYPITSFSGCIGCVFPTLADGTQPEFSYLFFLQDKLTSIPAELFAGITGKVKASMFSSSFVDTALSEIPSGLFSGITGFAPDAEYAFSETFAGTPITSIPPDLFAGIEITDTALPDNFFEFMFSECTNLTGPSARINGKYLYEIWPDATRNQVNSMYYGATGLDDYDNIPSNWK